MVAGGEERAGGKSGRPGGEEELQRCNCGDDSGRRRGRICENV